MYLAREYKNYNKKKLWTGGELRSAQIGESMSLAATPNIFGANSRIADNAAAVTGNRTAPKLNAGLGTGLANNAGGIAAMGTGIVDTIDQGNVHGRQSVGSYVAKGALSGAAAGTAILPGWGTAIGAVVGGAAGYIGGTGAKKKEDRLNTSLTNSYNKSQQARSAAQLTANPEMVTGYDQGAVGGYYAGGGQLGGGPDHQLYDDVNILLGKGGNPLNTLHGIRAAPSLNSPNMRDRQLMLTDLTIYNQRPDVQKMSPEQRIDGYYNTASSNPAVHAIKSRFKSFGSGPVSSYNNNPDIDKNELQSVTKLATGGPITKEVPVTTPTTNLAPVTVHGFKQKSTRDYYNGLQERQPDAFVGLQRMGEKYGFSTIDDTNTKVNAYDVGPAAGSYDNKKNIIKLYNYEGRDDFRAGETIIEEMAHKTQFDKSPIISELRHTYQSALNKYAGVNPYTDKGSLEYEAHSVIGPKLEEEYNGYIDKSYFSGKAETAAREEMARKNDPKVQQLRSNINKQREAKGLPAFKYGNGGPLFNAMSKHSTSISGPSHEAGGVDLGNNEVEGGETTDKGYVFSTRLGFAQQHVPLAKAIGKIESKPYTPAAANSLKRLNGRVDKLKQTQEYLKNELNIQ